MCVSEYESNLNLNWSDLKKYCIVTITFIYWMLRIQWLSH